MNFKQAKEKFEMVAGRKLELTTQRSYWTWLAMFLRFLGTAGAKEYPTSESRIERFLSDVDIRTTAGYGRKDCEGMISPIDRIVKFPMMQEQRRQA